MSKIFHREIIFNDPRKTWEKYKEAPHFFNFPERITVEITNRCNLRCFMCPRNTIDMKLGDMELEIFKKIIDEASRFLPVCLVPFFRGESLLHPQFIEMVTFAKTKGLKPIQMATNAYFLSSEISRSILDLEVDFISFSVDVNQPEIYRKIRKNSDFERVFSNILYFLEERKKRNLILPEIQVSAVKTEENSPFMRDFVRFWEDKVDRVRIYYEHSLDGKLGHLPEEGEEVKREPCLKILTDMVIYWNGDVAICNHDWQRDIFIGNVEHDSIEDIWKNKIYNKIRQSHLGNSLEEISPCNYCSHWEMYYRDNYIIGEVYEKNEVSPN